MSDNKPGNRDGYIPAEVYDELRSSFETERLLLGQPDARCRTGGLRRPRLWPCAITAISVCFVYSFVLIWTTLAIAKSRSRQGTRFMYC